MKDDRLISLNAAKDYIDSQKGRPFIGCTMGEAMKIMLDEVPPAQPESCEYYALCRHGRDENKLRVRLGFCKYCNEDADGFVTPLEKNGHAFVRFGMNGWEIDISTKGWHGSAKIRYCPMCGRDLLVK